MLSFPIREYRLDVQPVEGSWCTQVTRSADVSMRVLAMGTMTDGRVVEEVELLGTSWHDALARLREHPSVSDATLLRGEDESALVRVVHAGCPVARAISHTGVLPRFPLRVHEAREQVVVQASAAQAESFTRALLAGGMQTGVAGVRDATRASDLTPRQQEVLEAARRAGYYDAPRRISLSLLASQLGVAKSTLSELLVSIESKVMSRPRQ